MVSGADTKGNREMGSVGTKLTGSVIGSAGSWKGQGNVGAKAFDGSGGTFYDAANASGDWAGLDLGTPQALGSVTYIPRAGFAARMVGGKFQGSTSADFSTGVTTLYTVATAPPTTGATVVVSGTYRYVRYLGPAGGECNIAEMAFYPPSAPQRRRQEDRHEAEQPARPAAPHTPGRLAPR